MKTRGHHRQASVSRPAPIRGSHRQPRRLLAPRVWSVGSVIGRVVTVLAVAVAASTVLTLAWFNVHHQQVLIVTSGSMVPMFSAGDAVTVERPNPSELRVGDVVTFRTSAGGETTTHRIHQLKPRPEGLLFQTKGDANQTPDPNLVPASNVTGVMTGEIPYMGFWLAFFQSPLGKVLVLGTPLLLILIAQVISMMGDWRDVRQARTQASLTARVTTRTATTQ
jgi:signal peptidase